MSNIGSVVMLNIFYSV